MESARARWTLLVVSLALFMVTLDNLVVSTSLVSIRESLGASLEQLQWTVNAYTLGFAVFLLTGAALGDRLGRRRMFVVGIGVFTAASFAAALAPSTGALIAARAVQGFGAALVMPLTLTLLSEAFPPAKRGLALGIWAGVSGIGVALGPVIGGAIVEGISWHWIFWVNVPVGLTLIPLALRKLTESHGPDRRLDLPGAALASAGLFALVFGIVRSEALGWGSTTVLVTMGVGVVLLTGFGLWERRAPAPMLPLHFFKRRAFVATNGVSFAMFFGVFGAIFLLAQYFQAGQGFSPLEAGLRTLPWTAAPAVVAPIAGVLSGQIGARPLMTAGLAFQAFALGWLALHSSVDAEYLSLVPGLAAGGIGMGLVFAPSANAVLSSVALSDAGKASGATNTIREVGGALGVSVLATVFSGSGSYASPAAFVDGLLPALWVGVAVLVLGALVALLVPRSVDAAEADDAAPSEVALATA